jgi:hypothetical protein
MHKPLQGKDRNIVVELAGGLGNQMFQYTAGLFLALRNNCELILDTSSVGIGGTDHGTTLKNFKLRPDVVFRNQESSRVTKFFKRADNSLSNRSKFYARQQLGGIYRSDEVGYDKNLISLEAGTKVRGYFQTFAYADNLRDELLDSFELGTESAWYARLAEEAKARKPLMLHIRRGDYVSLKDDFGILAKDYYESAVDRLQVNEPDSEVWIFSDSPEAASMLMNESGIENWRMIVPPVESTPNETLKLLSLAGKLIIANSTFSWWGGYLNSNQAQICAPEIWFKNRFEPLHLIPEEWIRIQSHWEN